MIPLCAALAAESHELDPTLSETSALWSKEQICSSVALVDLSGASLRQILNLQHYVQPATDHATQYYPEVNDVTLIVNVPTFMSTIWGWVEVRGHDLLAIDRH